MQFNAEIEQLRTETGADAQKTRLLDDVAAYGAELQSFVHTG
jgi:hypothetical protein